MPARLVFKSGATAIIPHTFKRIITHALTGHITSAEWLKPNDGLDLLDIQLGDLSMIQNLSDEQAAAEGYAPAAQTIKQLTDALNEARGELTLIDAELMVPELEGLTGRSQKILYAVSAMQSTAKYHKAAEYLDEKCREQVEANRDNVKAINQVYNVLNYREKRLRAVRGSDQGETLATLVANVLDNLLDDNDALRAGDTGVLQRIGKEANCAAEEGDVTIYARIGAQFNDRIRQLWPQHMALGWGDILDAVKARETTLRRELSAARKAARQARASHRRMKDDLMRSGNVLLTRVNAANVTVNDLMRQRDELGQAAESFRARLEASAKRAFDLSETVNALLDGLPAREYTNAELAAFVRAGFEASDSGAQEGQEGQGSGDQQESTTADAPRPSPWLVSGDHIEVPGLDLTASFPAPATIGTNINAAESAQWPDGRSRVTITAPEPVDGDDPQEEDQA